MDLKRTFYAKYGKRLLDLALIIPGILLISPLLIVITLLVRRRLGRSALLKGSKNRSNQGDIVLHCMASNDVSSVIFPLMR
jgi:lipopolysaccharide/colanic/teichoic acid biosynthesis glycosyltransferase